MVAGKKVVDQVSGWLTLYDDGSVDRTWTGPPQFKFMAEPVPPHDDPIDGVATRDVLINANTGLAVRVYLPEKPTAGKMPIILHFHGGGFCISQADLFMYCNIYTRLARSAGAIVVSPYLRHAPEHRLPAAIDDGYSALLWLRELANKNVHDPWVSNGDFNRVFLIGDSSGGNLVHQVAKKAGGETENLRPLRLAGAIPVHPGFVRSVRSKSEMENPESPFFTLEMLDKFLELGLPEGSTKDNPVTCPMAEAVDEMNLPPYLLCVAEKDLVVDTQMEFYEAMKKGNKEIELFVSYGMGHSFYLNKIAIDVDPWTSDQTDKWIQGVTKFVENH